MAPVPVNGLSGGQQAGTVHRPINQADIEAPKGFITNLENLCAEVRISDQLGNAVSRKTRRKLATDYADYADFNP